MTAVRKEIVDIMWRGHEPFNKEPPRAKLDMQGWGSQHHYLVQAIDEIRPRIAVEIGVWKGGSVITMAKEMRKLELDCALVAVDTWLGAWDHWIVPEHFASLNFKNGYPTLFETFSANVMAEELEDFVVPLPLDSTNAANVFIQHGFIADVVHIDAGHDYRAVTNDLLQWWSLLRPGGILICDDYDPTGGWPEVLKAVRDFFATDQIENFNNKCIIRKGSPGFER